MVERRRKTKAELRLRPRLLEGRKFIDERSGEGGKGCR